MDEKKYLAEVLKREFGWGPQNAEGAVKAEFCCEYCGCDLLSSLNAYDSWQIDHIVPKKEGVDESLENIALSCRTCNLLKHDYHPKGSTRLERILDAKIYVMGKRKAKQAELQKLKTIVAKAYGENRS